MFTRSSHDNGSHTKCCKRTTQRNEEEQTVFIYTHSKGLARAEEGSREQSKGGGAAGQYWQRGAVEAARSSRGADTMTASVVVIWYFPVNSK